VTDEALVLLVAFAADAAFGDPPNRWHPVGAVLVAVPALTEKEMSRITARIPVWRFVGKNPKGQLSPFCSHTILKQAQTNSSISDHGATGN